MKSATIAILVLMLSGAAIANPGKDRLARRSIRRRLSCQLRKPE